MIGFLAVQSTAQTKIPPAVHARIIQLEDERNPAGGELANLLKHASPAVRERAALALGRIGDKRGTNPLIDLLQDERNDSVRSMAAFAIGEIEDIAGIPSLLQLLSREQEPPAVRARAAEALGKIASAQANAQTVKPASIADDLIRLLPDPAAKLTSEQKLLTTLTITALLRIRAAEAVDPLIGQLRSKDADIRAEALNALARIRRPLDPARALLIELLNDRDPIVRANAARVLALTKDAAALDPLIKSLDDSDGRVQVAAIRALAVYKEPKAAERIITRGVALEKQFDSDTSKLTTLLEIYSALGAIGDGRAIPFLREARKKHGIGSSSELEIAIAKFGEKEFFSQPFEDLYKSSLQPMRFANYAQGLGELKSEQSKELLLMMLFDGNIKTSEKSAILRALGATKPVTMPAVLRQMLQHEDAIVRGNAASLIADQIDERNQDALVNALIKSKADGANDAKLAIIRALSKYKSKLAIETVKLGLVDQDHLVRRAAVESLAKMDAGDFHSSIGTVQTGRNNGFYHRLVQRMNKKVAATIFTGHGKVVLELFPSDAPITVDSFITLARKGFFNNVAFHRVVANFVIQGGDPRGDGEGGPGRQIRCEINTRPYATGALGMALAGKDTGGSQFFITHSPQPHLDGGFTVFGQVVEGMEVVDRIARGDLIRRVTIEER